jgi:hypothetical protein
MTVMTDALSVPSAETAMSPRIATSGEVTGMAASGVGRTVIVTMTGAETIAAP